MGHMKGRRTDPAALRGLILEQEMTLREVSVATGLAYSFIKYVIAGERQMSDLSAHKVARVLGCNVDDFSTRPESEQAAA
jgi:cyanate lyase